MITGLCFKTHNELGRFCREKQYADYFEELLKYEKIDYKREFEIKNLVETSPQGNRIDFLVNNQIILEFKARKLLTKADYYQMQRYLRAAHLELGMLINFRNLYLKPKRILNDIYQTL
jgi:GxxExxY protein